MAKNTVEEGLDWLTSELKARDMNREDLERADGPRASSLANAYKRKKVGQDLAKQIANGLNLPVEVVYRRFGILPEKSTVDDEEAQILADLLNEIPDKSEREEAFSLAQMVIRHFSKGRKGKGATSGKTSSGGRHSAATY